MENEPAVAELCVLTTHSPTYSVTSSLRAGIKSYLPHSSAHPAELLAPADTHEHEINVDRLGLQGNFATSPRGERE